jgi:hypothetical protein
LAQAEANLDYLLASKPKRLEVAGGMLGEFDLDLPAGIAPAIRTASSTGCGARLPHCRGVAGGL